VALGIWPLGRRTYILFRSLVVGRRVSLIYAQLWSVWFVRFGLMDMRVSPSFS
jgi:hypothetical protein